MNFTDYILTRIAYHILQIRSKRNIINGNKKVAIFAFDDIGHLINLEGLYEKRELDHVFSWMSRFELINKDNIAIDIGANIGNHSLYFSKYFKSVHSFEPNPNTFKLLKINSELVDNIRIYNKGISNINTAAYLSVNETNNGNSFVANEKTNDTVEILLSPLDMSLEDSTQIDLIKIDVEGHEVNVIDGSQMLIRKNMPVILFEQHENDFVKGESLVISQLKSFGYKDFAVIKNNSHICTIKNRYLKTIISSIIHFFIGFNNLKIEFKNDITPGFYPFIIAIPPQKKSMIINQQIS